METIFYISYSLVLGVFTVFVLLSDKAPQTHRIWRMSDDVHGFAVSVHQTGSAYVVTIANMTKLFTSCSQAEDYAQEQYDLHSAVYAAWGKNIGR